VLIAAQACLVAIGLKAMRFPFAWEPLTMIRASARNIIPSLTIVRRGMRSPMTCRSIRGPGVSVQPAEYGGDAVIEASDFARCDKRLVPIMLGFERALDRDAEVFGLLLRKLREFDPDFLQVQSRDFFVEFLRQDVNADFVVIAIFP
jgi:hypothetical protein